MVALALRSGEFGFQQRVEQLVGLLGAAQLAHLPDCQLAQQRRHGLRGVARVEHGALEVGVGRAAFRGQAPRLSQHSQRAHGSRVSDLQRGVFAAHSSLQVRVQRREGAAPVRHRHRSPAVGVDDAARQGVAIDGVRPPAGRAEAVRRGAAQPARGRGPEVGQVLHVAQRPDHAREVLERAVGHAADILQLSEPLVGSVDHRLGGLDGDRHQAREPAAHLRDADGLADSLADARKECAPEWRGRRGQHHQQDAEDCEFASHCDSPWIAGPADGPGGSWYGRTIKSAVR